MAKATLRERSHINEQLARFQSIAKDVADMRELVALAEQDASLREEVASSLHVLGEKLARMRLTTLLSGEADGNDCYITIQAGSGGTEAQDWAQMLVRMYLRWAEKCSYKSTWLEENSGQEAGLKSATIHIEGHCAYGWLKHESGIHRLVRISPFDANGKRHTSFASVTVYPVIDDSIDVSVDDKELRIDTYRASGAGGQHVNKTDSAVRITHIPSGIVVQCQSNRSQHRNRAEAYRMLKARLYENILEERQAKANEQRGQQDDIGWGHQIRSYVLHPYQIVKDLRYHVEIGNAQSVLDGHIDAFLEAALSHQSS